MKNKLIIITLFICTACSYNCNKSIQNNTVEPIEKIKVLCPECKGTGKVKMSTAELTGFAIVTFGMGLLAADSPKTCETCRGRGYVEIPKLK